jgi:hypothetical protein
LAVEAFARRYAADHGLAYAETGTMPGGSSFLASADPARSHSFMRGPIAGGPEGLLLFTERVVDARRGIFQGWTATRIAVPTAREVVDGLACVPRLTPAWGGRVQLGSVLPEDLTPAAVDEGELDARYEVGVAGQRDRPALDALFSAEFIAWLQEMPFGRHGEASIRFELRRDVLCVYVREKQDTTGELDAFCERAAHIARHIEARLADLG